MGQNIFEIELELKCQKNGKYRIEPIPPKTWINCSWIKQKCNRFYCIVIISSHKSKTCKRKWFLLAHCAPARVGLSLEKWPTKRKDEHSNFYALLSGPWLDDSSLAFSFKMVTQSHQHRISLKPFESSVFYWRWIFIGQILNQVWLICFFFYCVHCAWGSWVILNLVHVEWYEFWLPRNVKSFEPLQFWKTLSESYSWTFLDLLWKVAWFR